MFTTTVCAALSAAGLAIALVTGYRRRFRRATRIAALSLVPIGLAMSGLVKVGGKIGTAVADWATDLVFKPTVWAGFAVLAVAVLLYLASRIGAGRSRARGERATAPAVPEAAARPAAAPAASRPALGAGGKDKSRGKPAGSGAGEDFSDVEAILKKHGI
jgi:hypothetical protein